MLVLNTEDFKEKIFDFTKSNEWKYNGNEAIVLKMGAEWCVPCKSVEKSLNSIKDEFKGKVSFYTVDIENDYQIAEALKIRSVPTIFFIPANGEKTISIGSISTEKIREKINEII